MYTTKYLGGSVNLNVNIVNTIIIAQIHMTIICMAPKCLSILLLNKKKKLPITIAINAKILFQLVLSGGGIKIFNKNVIGIYIP